MSDSLSLYRNNFRGEIQAAREERANVRRQNSFLPPGAKLPMPPKFRIVRPTAPEINVGCMPKAMQRRFLASQAMSRAVETKGVTVKTKRAKVGSAKKKANEKKIRPSRALSAC